MVSNHLFLVEGCSVDFCDSLTTKTNYFAFREKNEKAAEEEKLFKEKELEQLEKKIAEVRIGIKSSVVNLNISKVEKWRDEKLAEQSSTPLSEMPKLTVSMINSKVFHPI